MEQNNFETKSLNSDKLPADLNPQKSNMSEKIKKCWDKTKNWIKNQKKSTLILIVLTIVVIIAASVAVWARYFTPDTTESGVKKSIVPIASKEKATVPKLEISPLDGLGYQSNANRHPLGIMIENHPDARPQSGLQLASIVYEAITEGGITRFLAIFGPTDASETGPVRSARTFFVDWIEEYSGYYAHAGGSKDGLAKISSDKILDLPHTAGYFERRANTDIASEHTLFSSTAKLYQLATAKKYPASAKYDNLPMKDEAEQSKRGNHKSIIIDFSTASYKVEWSYDLSANTYNRIMAGELHKDKISGEQIKAKTIIIQTVERESIQLPGAKPTFKFFTTKGGTAKIIQDGATTDATWSKETGIGKRTKFHNTAGDEIKVNKGKRWYEIVPPGTPITETVNEPPAAPNPVN